MENDNSGINDFSKIIFTPKRSQNYFLEIELLVDKLGKHEEFYYKISIVESKAFINIINESDYEINEFYVKKSASSTWSENLISSSRSPTYPTTNVSTFLIPSALQILILFPISGCASKGR